MKTIIYAVMFILLISCASNGHHHKNHGHQRFDDAKAWEKVFESHNRDKWQKPDIVIREVGVKRNSLVADIGSGTGYFPIRLAKVATMGRVWGSDIEKNMVNFLNKRAKKQKFKNLFSILGTYEDPMIPEAVNFIFMVNTYHHIEKRGHYFKKLKSKLLTNGRLVIIDFKKKDLPFGPPASMKLSRDEIVTELCKSGYKLYKEPKILEYQNLLIFKAIR